MRTSNKKSDRLRELLMSKARDMRKDGCDTFSKMLEVLHNKECSIDYEMEEKHRLSLLNVVEEADRMEQKQNNERNIFTTWNISMSTVNE
jgi:hypothetical protein